MVEDSRDDIISDAHQVFAKWKSILAMGEVSTGALKIGKRVQSRRNFTHLLNSISSTPEVIVVIPDDDVEQYEGSQGATKHSEFPIQPVFQSTPGFSPPEGSGEGRVAPGSSP